MEVIPTAAQEPAYLKGLNPEQHTAVLATEGAVMVIAGAGSGKTRVIATRIAHIIAQRLARPHEILAVTFTNKAAREMRSRVESLLNTDLGTMWISTFHSFCARVLRHEIKHIPPFNSNFSIFDRDDQLALIRRIIKSSPEDGANPNVPTPSYFIHKISLAKNRMIAPEAYIASTPQEHFVAAAYPLYHDALIASNALDFDDLLLYTVQLLADNDAVREHYAGMFRYILVDEYQDTNQPQFRLLRYLESIHGNICVVGDPDQSIYRFRGADTANVEAFLRTHQHAGVQILPLSQNYRSTQPILEAANELIAPGRTLDVNKRLWTDRRGGNKPRLVLTADEREEAYFVAGVLQQALKAGMSLRNAVVLYRTHAQSRALEEAFRKKELPYLIVGGLRFYERKEIKDALAYLRIVSNPLDEISLARIINVPPRGAGDTTLERLREIARAKGIPLAVALEFIKDVPRVSEKSKKSLTKLGEIIATQHEELDIKNAGELGREILEQSGYLTWLGEQEEEEQVRLENVWELIAAAEEEPVSLPDFLSTVALVTDADQLDSESGVVSLMTLHTAKGLEFDLVIIVGLEENLLPHAQSSAGEDLAEERRLFYVGMTRARKDLVLTCAGRRAFMGMWGPSVPSRFLEDISAENLHILELPRTYGDDYDYDRERRYGGRGRY
jgi:DNA helicase II / ATP-dependent DNA helicase PcrA